MPRRRRAKLKGYLGSTNAQIRLGIYYANREGVEYDEAKATGWFRRAAEGGNVEAQVVLANRTLQGVGVERDPVAAAAWFRRAADSGLGRRPGAARHAAGRGSRCRAQRRGGAALPESGRRAGAPRRHAHARLHLLEWPRGRKGREGRSRIGFARRRRPACRGPRSCSRASFGRQRRSRATTPSRCAGIRRLRTRAPPVAQNQVGLAYLTGNGRREESRQAFEWFSKAAEKGDVLAAAESGPPVRRGHWRAAGSEARGRMESARGRSGEWRRRSSTSATATFMGSASKRTRPRACAGSSARRSRSWHGSADPGARVPARTRRREGRGARVDVVRGLGRKGDEDAAGLIADLGKSIGKAKEDEARQLAQAWRESHAAREHSPGKHWEAHAAEAPATSQ